MNADSLQSLIEQMVDVPEDEIKSLTLEDSISIESRINEKLSEVKKDGLQKLAQYDHDLSFAVEKLLREEFLSEGFTYSLGRLKEVYEARMHFRKDSKENDDRRVYLVSIKNRVLSARKLINVQKETKRVRQLKQAQYTAQVESEKLALLKAEEGRKAAEYEALLAEGRKNQTLQQAYANGDFIPVDKDNQIYVPSSTGKRLGARG